jgi:hypothetical protein
MLAEIGDRATVSTWITALPAPWGPNVRPHVPRVGLNQGGVVLAVPPPGDPARRLLAQPPAGAAVLAPHGMHRLWDSGPAWYAPPVGLSAQTHGLTGESNRTGLPDGDAMAVTRRKWASAPTASGGYGPSAKIEISVAIRALRPDAATATRRARLQSKPVRAPRRRLPPGTPVPRRSCSKDHNRGRGSAASRSTRVLASIPASSATAGSRCGGVLQSRSASSRRTSLPT